MGLLVPAGRATFYEEATRILKATCRPRWLRVYECSTVGTVRLLKDLRPLRQGEEATEYLDEANDVPARSARIYVFRRTGIIAATSNPGRAA
jgi:hypothetical protein